MQSYTLICVLLSCLVLLSCIPESDAYCYIARVRRCRSTPRGNFCYYVNVRRCYARKKRDLQSSPDSDKVRFYIYRCIVYCI